MFLLHNMSFIHLCYDVTNYCFEIDDNDGSETNVGTITVAKGKVWDNRSGIGALGDDVDVDKEDADIDINATYTTFDGKAKEAWKIGGMCIRQAK